MNRRTMLALIILLAALAVPAMALADNAHNTKTDLANVNVSYSPTNFGETPVIRKTATTVHIGGNHWVKAYHNARLVDVVYGGVLSKQLKLVKNEQILLAQISYVGVNGSQTYTSVPWDGKAIMPIRTTMTIGGVVYQMRINNISVLIYERGRPIPPLLARGVGPVD